MFKSIFSQEPNELTYTPKNAYAFVWEICKGYRHWLIFGIFLSFLLSLFKIFVSVFFSDMIGYFAKITPETIDWQVALIYILKLSAIFLAIPFLRYFREIRDNDVRRTAIWKVRRYGLSYISKHSENYISKQKSGQLAAKMSEVSKNTEYMLMANSRMFSCFWLVTISFYYIGSVSLWFLLLVTIVGSFSAYYSFRITNEISLINKDVAEKESRLTGTMSDSLSNILLVKMFGNEKFERQNLQKYIDDVQNVSVKSVKAVQNMFMLQRMIILVFRVMGASLAIWLWANHKIDVSQVVLILLLLDDLLSYFERILAEMLMSVEAGGRLMSSLEPLQTPHDLVNIPNAKNLKVKKGAISIKNISFGYDDNSKGIFNGLSLEIKPLERIGIIGKTGSGKSTLINLIQRNFDIASGEILIDGQDISKVTQESIHESLAIIPQDNSLFHRTIRQNIVYGNPQASAKQLEQASKLAFADEFIEKLPRGYSTLVGDRGVKLSGGQRQRVAIARAILKDSPILILDEATSALDSQSEKYIAESLQQLMQGRTVIAIAHRLSTLQNMDRIIVMDKGKIIETGTPDELIDKGGKFAKIWKLQSN